MRCVAIPVVASIDTKSCVVAIIESRELNGGREADIPRIGWDRCEDPSTYDLERFMSVDLEGRSVVSLHPAGSDVGRAGVDARRQQNDPVSGGTWSQVRQDNAGELWMDGSREIGRLGRRAKVGYEVGGRL